MVTVDKERVAIIGELRSQLAAWVALIGEKGVDPYDITCALGIVATDILWAVDRAAIEKGETPSPSREERLQTFVETMRTQFKMRDAFASGAVGRA